MNISDCYCLGRITKPWGVKGQLVLFLDVDSPDDYLDLDSAFVEIKGQLVPHFFHIDNINGNKAGPSTCCRSSTATASTSTKWQASASSTASMAT